VLDVLLAGPYDIHRSIDLLAMRTAVTNHVGIEPPQEAAADQMGVPGHFSRAGSGLGRLRLTVSCLVRSDLAASGLK